MSGRQRSWRRSLSRLEETDVHTLWSGLPQNGRITLKRFFSAFRYTHRLLRIKWQINGNLYLDEGLRARNVSKVKYYFLNGVLDFHDTILHRHSLLLVFSRLPKFCVLKKWRRKKYDFVLLVLFRVQHGHSTRACFVLQGSAQVVGEDSSPSCFVLLLFVYAREGKLAYVDFVNFIIHFSPQHKGNCVYIIASFTSTP